MIATKLLLLLLLLHQFLVVVVQVQYLVFDGTFEDTTGTTSRDAEDNVEVAIETGACSSDGEGTKVVVGAGAEAVVDVIIGALDTAARDGIGGGGGTSNGTSNEPIGFRDI